MLKYIANHTV